MESLSRPFRRKKLPSFSAYDDVFAGGNGGAPAAFSSRIEDYKEIFRGSCSSIPVLDLSALDGAADVAGGLGKKMDYSKIFGGGRDDDVAASYEEVFAQRSPAKKASRINEPTLPGCRKEEENQNGTPNQSLEGAKQYNTFYNRTSQGNKDGENGKTLVAHIKAVPGFTCFIDENIKKTGDKFGSLPKDKTRPTPKVSVELDKKQSTNGAEKIKSQSSLDKLNSLDRNVDANGSNLKTQSFKQSSPARAPVSTASDRKNSGELKFYIPKSGVSKNGPDDCSRSFSDEELDVDSAAAVSSAALRKAVREAEASIRLAKEIMEKNKNGFQKFPKIKKKIVEKSSIQATKTEKNYPNLKENEEANVGVRETNNAKSNSDDDGQAHITKLERKKSRKSGKMSPNFIQSVENCVAENIFGKRNEDKLEASADFKAEGRFPEPLKIDDYKTENSELKHPIGNYMRLFSRIFPGNVNEHKLETSADSKSQGQFPDLVTNENQKKEALEMGATNVCNNIFSIHNISGKVDEDMLERSSDSEKLGERPNLLKKENQRNATLELENTGDNISPSICNVPGKLHKDKSEPSDDFNALGQLSKPVKTDNQRSVTLELGHTNESKFMSSIPSFSEKENEEILEKTDNQRSATLELGHTDDSKFMSSVHSFSEKENEEILEKITDSEDLPESVKTDQGSATLELGHTNDSKFMSSVHSFSEKENEEILEKITDSEKLPESVKTDNQGSATLELGHTNDSKFMSSVHSFSEKENEEILGKFTDSEDLLEPVKTDKQRSATLELGHTNDSKFMSSVLSFSEKENVEILETFIDSEDFIEPEKTDNRRTATLELGHTDCSETRPSVHSFSEKENEEKLETFTDPEDFIEPEKIDNQRAATLELGDTDCSEIKPPVHGISEQVNTEMLEKSADSEPLGQVPELEKINNQRTEILELENISGSNIDSSVHDILRKVNEGKFEPSADPEALETFPELVKTDNLRTATLELGHNYDTNIIPSVYNTNECGEMENQTDERTSELLERNSKEVHRKRKQWKDFEQKPSDIKIAVDGREEGKLEPLEGPSKEINRKRRQWKDVEVKSYDIKIADDGEKCIHGQEMREKATNVEDKPKGFSSGDLYENEVVKSPEREKMEDFESLDVNINRGEDFDEAQKFMENEKIKPDITNSLTGIHERESVINIWKHNEIENNLQESSKWRDYEVAFEVESNESGKNSNIDAWKEDGSEHLGDCHVAHKHERDDDDNSFEGSERMSDASQSSIDYKEDFIFDEEEVGETSEVFQSCEFNAFETGSRFAENQVSFIFNEIPESSDSDGNGSGAKQMEFVGNDSELIYDTCDGVKASAQMQEEDKARGVYEQEWVKMRNIKEAFQPPNLSKEKIRGNYEVEEKTTEKSRQEEVRAEKEELERNDEITKREREREKNRIVVERAIREARERAYAEARERAERAAVEKATAEARERVMAEARQKFEKTNISNKSSTEKASIQAKLRSERAAVERAHAEARERALEKALSQKSNLPPSKMDGNNGESVERRNARLEKTQRTMERAAKALAEKNMRDLRAQREQAERHRLAETLDAEIKRWSSGKTGNLRALLSTLQYILGPDSGWQPVSLTEIVATSAVKKAYRKATLHVHPDKLQQRGASIQQKYICEKVFDLLKAAWNRFNSEER